MSLCLTPHRLQLYKHLWKAFGGAQFSGSVQMLPILATLSCWINVYPHEEGN